LVQTPDLWQLFAGIVRWFTGSTAPDPAILHCFFLVLTVGHMMKLASRQDTLNLISPPEPMHLQDHNTVSTALLGISVFVTSPATPSPLSSCLEQCADLVIDQLGDVSHLIVRDVQLHLIADTLCRLLIISSHAGNGMICCIADRVT